MTDIESPSEANTGRLPQVVAIPLGNLVPNPVYQPRGLSDPVGDGVDDPERWLAGLDLDQLESLRASQQQMWPPLLVTPSEHQIGRYDLLDGFHRYAVARERAQAEHPENWHEIAIPCRIIADGGVDTAIAANIRHGLPLSLADRKAAARLFHQLDTELSYRQIAAKVGLSDKTVKAALMRQNGAEYPHLGEGDAAPVARSPDPIQKLVKLALAASNERTGTNWLAQIFSHKTDHQQQVDYVAQIITQYQKQERAQIVQALLAMGRILTAGAERVMGNTPSPA
jgi:ParB-like chromosome segregation protein Spo0J